MARWSNFILLAEDYEDDELHFKRMLKESGLGNPVVVVRDGEETIAYLEGRGQYADRTQYPLPGILMLDWKLPKLNGLEVLQWLRAQPQFRDLLVILLTGEARVAELRQAYEAGADSFLYKPCNAQDLMNLAEGFRQQWTQPWDWHGV